MSAPSAPRRRAAGTPRSGAAPATNGWGADEVCVQFGERLALDRITFHAAPAQVSAVVGGDGAGRTTLLRCLAGALAPSSGRVRRPPALRIGYLPTSSGVYPDLTVAENLQFRATTYRVPADVARERAGALLERAGLTRAVDRLAGHLSGGMRQKLGVIAAMLHEPDLLILDEPTTGVDPVSRADLWWLIGRAAVGGAAVVLATSYLDEAERASCVLALDAGRELASGAVEQIVAAMPGHLRAADERPAGEAGSRAWLREGRWRVWEPAARPARPAGPGDGVVEPDLQDAVTVAALVRELQAAGQRAPAGAGPAGSRAADSRAAATAGLPPPENAAARGRAPDGRAPDARAGADQAAEQEGKR